MSTIINPYKGPFPFSSIDEDVFFGRKKETEQLVTHIKNRQLTIIFGTSGTGKTSLIQAKLLPELKRQYFHPIYLRINFGVVDPLAYTRTQIVEELKKWDPEQIDFGPNQTIIDFAANTRIFKGLVKPVLFFDQFEELFTLGPKNDATLIHNFMLEIADLIEHRLPENLKHTENYKNLHNFKVVFSLRQDWVAYLEDYSGILPSILENRYRLKKFSYSQALEAILYPSKNTISRKTAQLIIKKIGTAALWENISDETFHEDKALSNLEIDPFVLSLYCYELFENTCIKKDSSISSESVESNNHVELIRSYYKKSIKDYPSLKKLIEEKLLNESGKRLTLSLTDFSSNKDTLNEVNQLVANSGILRIIGEGDSAEVEIVHDQLANRIFEGRKAELFQKAKEEELQASLLRNSAKTAKRITIAVIVLALLIAGIATTMITIKLTDANSKLEFVKKQAVETSIKTQKFIDSAIKNFTVDSLRKQLLDERNTNATIKNDLITIIETQKNQLKNSNIDTTIIVNRINAKFNESIANLNKQNQELRGKITALEQENENKNKEIERLTIVKPIVPSLPKPTIGQVEITKSGEPLSLENDSIFLIRRIRDLDDYYIRLKFRINNTNSVIQQNVEVSLSCPLSGGGYIKSNLFSKKITSQNQIFSCDFKRPDVSGKQERHFNAGKYTYTILINGVLYKSQTFEIKLTE